MINALLSLGLALGFALEAGAPGEAAATRPRPFAPPRLAIDPPGRVDLGELGPLQPRTQAYRFTNTSAAPIALRVLDRSPGVTVAGPALERPIPPKGSAFLALRVDPEDWVGPQARNVRLGTDDPGQGNYYLPIRFQVRPDLTVDGVRRSLGDMPGADSRQAVFTFTRETGKPVALRVTTELPPYLEWETQGLGPQVQLTLTLRAARIPPGMRMGLERVRVETNAPQQPAFDLYLEWRVHHPVEAAPARVVFQDPEPAVLELELRSRGGTPFLILGADLEGEGFQVGPMPAAPAPVQTLAIRRTARGTARAMLVLRFSGEEESLKVPLAYLPSRPPQEEGVKVESVPRP